jgi:hypothetical protein
MLTVLQRQRLDVLSGGEREAREQRGDVLATYRLGENDARGIGAGRAETEKETETEIGTEIERAMERETRCALLIPDHQIPPPTVSG